MVTAAEAPAFLRRDDLDRLIALLRDDGRTVIGPTVADGAIVYDEIRSAADLPAGWRDEQAPGKYRLVEARQRADIRLLGRADQLEALHVPVPGPDRPG